MFLNYHKTCIYLINIMVVYIFLKTFYLPPYHLEHFVITFDWLLSPQNGVFALTKVFLSNFVSCNILGITILCTKKIILVIDHYELIFVSQISTPNSANDSFPFRKLIYRWRVKSLNNHQRDFLSHPYFSLLLPLHLFIIIYDSLHQINFL